MAAKIAAKLEKIPAPPVSFTKEQLLKSEKYHGKRDLLTALLKDGGTYTTEKTDALIDNFMKGKVK